MRSYSVLDVSGLGNAGKTAVVDFLREFSGTQAFNFSLEFDLFRIPNGILDLHHHLVEDWSPIRSNYALRAFEMLCFRLAGSAKRKNLKAFLSSSGHGYEAWFKGNFYKLAKSYSDSFVEAEYMAFWPYYMTQNDIFKRVIKKIDLKLKNQKRLLDPIYLVSSEDFEKRTSNFVYSLFDELVEDSKKHLILNNTFEPFNPTRGLNLVEGSKIIVVYRDPRDVFVSGQNASRVSKQDISLQAVDNNGFNKSFLGADSVEVFIKRQNLYFSKMYRGNDKRILLVKFEDFVLDHANERKKIMNFLNLIESEHSYSGKFFKPEESRKNIGAWRNYTLQDEIRYIEKNIKEKRFLFNE